MGYSRVSQVCFTIFFLVLAFDAVRWIICRSLFQLGCCKDAPGSTTPRPDRTPTKSASQGPTTASMNAKKTAMSSGDTSLNILLGVQLSYNHLMKMAGFLKASVDNSQTSLAVGLSSGKAQTIKKKVT